MKKPPLLVLFNAAPPPSLSLTLAIPITTTRATTTTAPTTTMPCLTRVVVLVVAVALVLMASGPAASEANVIPSTQRPPAAAVTRRPWSANSAYGPSTPSPHHELPANAVPFASNFNNDEEDIISDDEDDVGRATSPPSAFILEAHRQNSSSSSSRNTGSRSRNTGSNGNSRSSSRGRNNGGNNMIFSCPAQICDCYELRPENKIWLNCTVPRLQGTVQQREMFRGIRIPIQGSELMTITCSTPARSYLYGDMISQLSHLRRLQLVNCKFHDIPRDVFRGLGQLEIMQIDGANLLGHVDPEFASHLPELRLLEIIRSRVTFLPPLCRSTNLRTLNVSYNNIADFDHAGVNCADSPLAKLEILDVSYNDITSLPTWLGDSIPNLLRMSGENNAIRAVGSEFCTKMPTLGFLDLSENSLNDVSRVKLSNCTQLRVLSLGNNPLGSPPPGSLESMPHLQRLFLHSTRLTDGVIWSRIVGLRKLNLLDLHNNSLVNVPALAMRELRDLVYLDLSSNAIRDLPKKSFVNQYRLRYLGMSSNGLEYLPRMAFSSMTSLVELDLANNTISGVDQMTFAGLRNLVRLNISNNALGFIPDQAFAIMSNLQVLDLSRNSLASINGNAFNRMGSLVGVFLSHNELQTIPSMSRLYGLDVVDLSHNNLTSLPPTMFTGLNNLTVVILKSNRFASLSTKTFHDCRNLHYLDLSHNRLTGLTSVHFVNVQELKYLDLSYNDIPTISTTFQSLKLRTLLLRHNRLKALQRGEVSSTVQMLDLSQNQISHISPFTFAAAVGLRLVNLTYNDLTSLSSNTMEISFSQVQYSQPVFYLRGNPLRCDCELGWLKDWSLDRIPSSVAPLPDFGDLKQLLCHSSIIAASTTISTTMLGGWPVGAGSTSIRSSSNNNDWYLVNMAREEFLCPYSRKCGEGCVCCGFDMCYCKSTCPRNCSCYIGDNLLPINRVDCSKDNREILPDGIPEAATEIWLDGNSLGTLQAMSFLGHGSTLLLRLNHSDIYFIENNTFRGMKSLTELYLDDNFLGILYATIFKDLENLEVLHLQNNEITFVEQGAFSSMKNLKVLNLERNLLVTLSFADFVSASEFSSLSLNDNPWTCGPNFTCAFFRFLANSSAVVKDLPQLKCYDYESDKPRNTVTSVGGGGGGVTHGGGSNRGNGSNGGNTGGSTTGKSNVKNGTLVLALPLEQCGGDNFTDTTTPVNATRPSSQSVSAEQEISWLIVVSVLSVLLITALIAIYVNRHLLEVWCFTKFGWRVFRMAPGHGGAAEDENRPYDAFVSYSNLDEDFVVAELAPRLENGYKRFKLCLHYRDFPVGASIAETIVRSVESSKRTIILISNNFLASEWCKFEFQTAHQQVLTERKNRVILILLHDLDESKLDQTLKLYMMTRTYLRYDDPWFWEKLMFAMPDKKEEKFERLPSSRDLEYVARFGRSPSKTPTNGTPPTTASRRNGHVNTGADMMIPNDMYEIPVEDSGTYERVTENLSLSSCSGLYNGGGSVSGSGHYEEVKPRGYVMRHFQDTCTCGTPASIQPQQPLPPPLPPLPKRGLLSHEEVKQNSPRHSSKEVLSKEENWV